MRTLIISPERVRRTFSRLAYEVIERNRGAEQLVLFGILNQGLRVAEALAAHIAPLAGQPLLAHPLDVKAFRDDRPIAQPAAQSPAPPRAEGPRVTGKNVVLVDDVLYTGRTARAALDAVVRYGRPASIQLVVLVDRGHREVPIQPNYVGRNIQTKHKERVVVEVDEDFAIYVEE